MFKQFIIGLKQNFREYDNLSTRDKCPVPSVSSVRRFYCTTFIICYYTSVFTTNLHHSLLHFSIHYYLHSLLPWIIHYCLHHSVLPSLFSTTFIIHYYLSQFTTTLHHSLLPSSFTNTLHYSLLPFIIHYHPP